MRVAILNGLLGVCDRLAVRFFSLDEQRQSPLLTAVEAGREGRSSMPLADRRSLDRLTMQAGSLEHVLLHSQVKNLVSSQGVSRQKQVIICWNESMTVLRRVKASWWVCADSHAAVRAGAIPAGPGKQRRHHLCRLSTDRLPGRHDTHPPPHERPHRPGGPGSRADTAVFQPVSFTWWGVARRSFAGMHVACLR